MKAGDRIQAPPAGAVSLSGWLPVTIERMGTHRTIRDQTSDRDHRPHQWVHVVYDDGSREQFDRYFLERHQPGD